MRSSCSRQRLLGYSWHRHAASEQTGGGEKKSARAEAIVQKARTAARREAGKVAVGYMHGDEANDWERSVASGMLQDFAAKVTGPLAILRPTHLSKLRGGCDLLTHSRHPMRSYDAPARISSFSVIAILRACIKLVGGCLMNTPDRAAGQKPSVRSTFPTTHWSVVRIAAGEATQEAGAAMEALCRQYWFPIYTFIRRHGRSHHEAEDLTQEFITRLLDRDLITRAQPERGRFRTFLLTALRHFLTNEWHRAQTARSGGGRAAVAAMLDFRSADERFAREPVDAGLTPEAAFDRAWALNVIERAMVSLRDEYTASGGSALFDAVAPIVWGGGKSVPLAVAAQQLGMKEGALKVAIHRLRKRLRGHVEELVAETVEDTTAAAAEVRHLIDAVAVGRRVA